jgi:hypothetical protein
MGRRCSETHHNLLKKTNLFANAKSRSGEHPTETQFTAKGIQTNSFFHGLKNCSTKEFTIIPFFNYDATPLAGYQGDDSSGGKAFL